MINEKLVDKGKYGTHLDVPGADLAIGLNNLTRRVSIAAVPSILGENFCLFVYSRTTTIADG